MCDEIKYQFKRKSAEFSLMSQSASGGGSLGKQRFHRIGIMMTVDMI